MYNKCYFDIQFNVVDFYKKACVLLHIIKYLLLNNLHYTLKLNTNCLDSKRLAVLLIYKAAILCL